MQITAYINDELDHGTREKLYDLLHSIWPQPHRTKPELMTDWFGGLNKGKSYQKGVRYVIWENEKAIAHAMSFERKIFTLSGPMTVLALAGVCTSPESREKGLGSAVVKSAFVPVDSGVYPAALFQTGVPMFYVKLNCRMIDNPFCNRQNKAQPNISPWWDKHVMIYPANYAWPEGLIDLNGGAY